MCHPPLPGVELVSGQVRTWGLGPAGAWGESADYFGWRFVSSVTEVAFPRWARGWHDAVPSVSDRPDGRGPPWGGSRGR